MRKKLPETEKKIASHVTLNSDIIELMDELIDDIGNTNRSRYIEKLVREDIERRGIKIEKKF